MPLSIAVLVSGRGSNFQAIVDACESGEIDGAVRLMVTDSETAPALDRAKKHGIKSVFLDPKRFPDKESYDRNLAGLLEEHSVDLVCLAGFMRILGPDLVRRFSGRIMNVHPSLLPSFPGLNAQRQALQYGVKWTGCTVHFVDEGVDTGPIIFQTAVPVLDTDTETDLSDRILKEEHALYVKAIRAFSENRLRIENRRVFHRS
jgi:phosphoribosylglycinamide formyltransferase-1